jgi:transcription antitermination protein NusB
VGARREGREFALQLLYSLDVNPLELRTGLALFWDSQRAPQGIREFAENLVAGVAEHRAQIDGIIEQKSKNWSLGRMSKVDINILRLSVYEILYCDDIPINVTINEAIEIAKKFGTEESPAFVNGILDEIAASVPEKIVS